MKTLVLSDLHAHNWPRFSTVTPEGLNSRFQDLLDVLDQAKQVIETHGITSLVLLGDLTHRRHFITFKLYNALMVKLAFLSSMVEKTLIVVGNHDLEEGVTHSLTPLSFLPHTWVIESPTDFKRGFLGAPFTVIPYMDDPARVSDAFGATKSEHVILSHYAAEGCPLETDYYLPSPVKLMELHRHPLVVFGHVHKPSDQLNGKVVYNGAPMQFDFGDAGPRGGLIVHEDLTWERVWFTAPTFHTVTYPRIPTPPDVANSPRAEGAVKRFLRVLNVPKAEMSDVRAHILDLGWSDGLILEATLPPEVKAAVSRGLVVDEATLRAWVVGAAILEAEQEVIVQKGLEFLEAVR